MRILFVSTRGTDPQSVHWSARWSETAVGAAREQGIDAQWICPLPDGVRFEPGHRATEIWHPFHAKVAPFRNVDWRQAGPRIEQALVRNLRENLPDLVHVVGMGGGGSAAVCWITERMGGKCVVTCRAAELLCHRQTLMDWTGAECAEHEDAARCRRCCTTVPEVGEQPSAMGARLASACGFLGGWSPFPNETAFLNRFDALFGGVAHAERVTVPSDEDATRLQRIGIAAKKLVTLADDPPDSSALAELWSC